MTIDELNVRVEKCETDIENAFVDISMMYDVLFNALYETLIGELKDSISNNKD